jgi:hypothetical protein
MFPRFLFESSVRISGLRAGRLRGRHPDRRPSDRNRVRVRLEALEDRRLLSGISGFIEFPVLTASSHPLWVTTGPDGNLWFTESALSASKIGVISPTTHAVAEFATPTANSGPWGITSGPDSNLWFTESFTHKVGEIDPTTHGLTEFVLSPRPASVREGSRPVPMVISGSPTGAPIRSERSTRRPMPSLHSPSRVVGHPMGSRRAPMATSGSPRI